jgi:hypothetical protein
MSAYIVSKKIIDAIVTVASTGPMGHRGYGQGWSDLIQYAKYDGLNVDTPSALGAALWLANVRSVNYRYQERNPGFMKCAREYVYEPVRRRPTVLEALSLLGTYEYQSCERADWLRSPECRFVERMRSTLLYWIPGYCEANWQES